LTRAANILEQSNVTNTAIVCDLKEDLPFPHPHYALKHRFEAWVSLHFFDNVTYTVRRGLLKGMKRRGGLAWIPRIFSGDALNPEEQFLCRLGLTGATVYDVGAFHGLMTLFFSSRAGRVVCFEPNTENRKRLNENLKLNGVNNVEVRSVGVGSRRETRRMVGSPLMRGIASVDEKTVEEFSRVWAKPEIEEISIVTLDEEIARASVSSMPAPDFIKIDVEGWELEVLRGASNTLEFYKPALFLEMHGETIREKKKKVTEIVSFLFEHNYRSIRHIETGSMIRPENAYVAMEGHLHCSMA